MSTTVSSLFRYPVKSMGGESHTELTIAERGAVGDRVWAVRDEVRGGIRGAKKIPALMTLSAKFTEDARPQGSSAALITAADGSSCKTDAEDVNAWLSDKLSHAVTLWPLLPADALEHYRRGAPDHEDLETELREVFARTPDESLPDLSLFAEVLEFESPPGTYFDAFPIHILTKQFLTSLSQHRTESVFHVDRFRPNLLLDAPDSDNPFPENEWVGRQLTIGDVVLDVIGECPRCAMTTHGFGDLPKDPSIMRTLVRASNGNAGVYAKVVKGGVVRAGDSVELSGSA
ncbi:MAG: MOSC N-terminal beta barrel domain-containing protein [Pseudomonadota bacterium]